MKKEQSRRASLLEAGWNTAAGFALRWAVWVWLMVPAIHKGWLEVEDGFIITAVYTALSLGRSYVVRRCAVLWSRWKGGADRGGDGND